MISEAELRARDLEALAVAGHGALVILHALGLLYHLERRRLRYAAVHLAGLAFDAASLRRHLRSLRS